MQIHDVGGLNSDFKILYTSQTITTQLEFTSEQTY